MATQTKGAMESLLDEYRKDPKFQALASIVDIMEGLEESDRHQVVKDLNKRYAPPKRTYRKRQSDGSGESEEK